MAAFHAVRAMKQLADRGREEEFCRQFCRALRRYREDGYLELSDILRLRMLAYSAFGEGREGRRKEEAVLRQDRCRERPGFVNQCL